MTCSGAWTTTNPAVSKPARPARPAIWRNSRVFRTRCRLPSNFASPVKSTVRIGTLMPTPRVSVPQMTVSRPAWARVSTRRRYFGSIPAWCTPMPAFTSFCSVLPKPAPNRKAPIFSAMASLCCRSILASPPTPSSRVACSTALACVKCTTYAGAWPVVTSSSTVSSSGSTDHRKLRGTGRSASSTTAVARPVRRVRSAAISETSPRVADISTNCASRQLQERHLPRPAAVRLAVVVELVHHHQPDVGAGALAQGDVGEHLGGAGDDRRVGVDAGVAGQHADVVGPEHLAQREELLAHQRLDRRGVERHPPVGQRRQVSTGRDQRLPRPRRRRQHHVAAAQQLDQRLVLVRVERQPLLPRPLGEGEVQGVGVALVRDDEAGHGRGHASHSAVVEEGALAPVTRPRRSRPRSSSPGRRDGCLAQPSLDQRCDISRGRGGGRWRRPRAGSPR